MDKTLGSLKKKAGFETVYTNHDERTAVAAHFCFNGSWSGIWESSDWQNREGKKRWTCVYYMIT